MQEENKKLYIPVNIRRRKEIAEGFGKKEIVQTIFMTVIGITVGVVLFLIKDKQILYLTLVPVIFAMGTMVFVKKNKRNMNTIDQIKMMLDFSKSQKRYYYKYCNIHERKVHGKEKR